MVLGGSLWFFVVLGGSWRFLVVLGGSWWFLVVLGGSWWFLVIFLLILQGVNKRYMLYRALGLLINTTVKGVELSYK